MPTVTIFAGISGIDKSEFVKNFIKKSGKQAHILNLDFEKELLNEEREGNSSPDIASFLDSPSSKLKLNEIESTFGWLAKKIDERDSKITDIFLNIHLSYFKNSEFFPPFIPLFFRQLTTKIPDANMKIITLIDDVFSIWDKIKKREDEKGFLNTVLRLREILAWRSLESLNAEALKEYLNTREEGKQRASNYIVSVRHPFNTFYNLIFNEKPVRLYLSYPISETRKDPKDILEINEFRKQMHKIGSDEGIVVFDPVAIDELAMENAVEEIPVSQRSTVEEITLEQKHRWPLEVSDILVKDFEWPITIPKRQIDEVSSDIRNQITSRDYTLVDSSQFLAVYRPFYRQIMSRGADAEIKHAKEYGKKVIVYHPKEDKGPQSSSTHPFGSKVDLFEVKEKFFEHLQKLITQKKGKDK